MLPLLPLLISGISGIGGALGNRSSTTNQTGSSTTSSNPIYDPKSTGFRDDIIGSWMNLLNKDPNLTGYQSSRISGINSDADLQRQAVEGNLASRGIRGPAAATAVNNVDSQRFKATTELDNSLPLLAQQIQQSILGGAGSFFSSIPYGTQSNTQTKGQVTEPGNVLGGGLGNLGTTLAYLLGQGAFKKV